VSAEEQRRRRLRHDLRTPLTIVSGFAEVLAADRAISDADRREYASRIQAAAVEIGELVDAILEDRPRDGGPPPPP
jgi:signal transduction histidine kinase